MEPVTQIMTSPSTSVLRIRGMNGWFPPYPPLAGEQAVLTAADVNQLAAISRPRVMAAGDALYNQGDEADDLFLIRSGIVRVSNLSADGHRHILAFHWQGDLCGLMGDGRYVNSAFALCPTQVLAMPRRRLHGLLLSQPMLQNEFLVKAANDLRNSQRMLIALSGADAAHRLAAFLLECTHHEDHYDPRARIVTLFADRRDIADYLALSGETISRAFGQLEHAGLIRRQSTRNIAIDPETLAAYVGK